tara:strand:+ start:2076 stop:2234 length:159 start_codon:yes stop_codon:yes gene_type:complete
MKQINKIETHSSKMISLPKPSIKLKEKNMIEEMFIWNKKLNRAVRVYGKGKK